jgi:hypothetical protein
MTKIEVLFAVLSSALFGTALQGQTINAASCNASDVQSALNSVSADGTTVVIPAGNCTWASTITYNQVYATTIQGQTTCVGTPASSCTDRTIITDNLNRNGYDPGILEITTAAGKSFRLTGITFAQINGTTTARTYLGSLRLFGRSQAVRVDHCHFNNIVQVAMTEDGPLGVMDHVVADINSEFMRPLNSSWNGVGDWGDNAFAQPTGFGTDQFFFLEDSTMNGPAMPNGGGTNDCYRGGKFVVRHNQMNYTSVQGHGTGHAGEDRGCRAAELYLNTFSNPSATQFNAFFESGGPAMIWGNTAPNFSNFITAHINREDRATYTQTATPNGWGYCGTTVTGTGSSWDQSSTTSAGYACLDQVGRGRGDLLARAFPNRVNTATGTSAWPRQAVEPVYVWSNTWSCPGCGGTFWSSSDSGIVQNRDYFMDVAASCSGGTCATGVGVGTLANRPTSCTTNSVSYPAGNNPGVGYWATDKNTLYVCTATNTWTAYYTPYTYPHPLTNGTPQNTNPAPPTNLVLTVH